MSNRATAHFRCGGTANRFGAGCVALVGEAPMCFRRSAGAQSRLRDAVTIAEVAGDTFLGGGDVGAGEATAE
jgi:hypothetical protein